MITIEREYWQLLFLQRLYLTPQSENLFFKGGTAIRFLLGSFRFSEDLDFTATIAKRKVENLLLETFSFFKINTVYNLEFKKEKVWQKFAEESLKYRFLFKPASLTQRVSIRMDVSFREKPTTRENSVLVPFDYPISPYPLVSHLGKEEILAEKIRALFVRKKPRDLFDLWFLLTKKVPINQKIINKKFSFYPGLKFNLASLKKAIASYEESELKKDLNPFLPENYRGFYKKIKEEAIGLVNL